MLETGTKATSTSYWTSSLPETQLAEIWTRPVPKLRKKKQTLYSRSALKSITSMALIYIYFIFVYTLNTKYLVGT